MDESSHRKYVDLVSRQGWLILLVPLIAVNIGWFIAHRTPPVYRASMKLVVGQAGGASPPVIGTRALTQTMTNLIQSTVVADEALRTLHLRRTKTPESVTKHMKVHVKPDSSVLEVTYDSHSRQRAVRVLGEVATVFTGLVRAKLGLQSGGSVLEHKSGEQVFFATVFDPPHLNPGRVSPHPKKTMLFAGFIGLVIGVLLALGRDSIDDRIRSRRQAENWFGAPVLGTLPKSARGKVPPAITGHVARGQESVLSAIYLLRANLEFSGVGSRGPRILVTSAADDEGTSAVVANLGAALAIGGKRVVCVEADMRSPRLHRYLGLDDEHVGLVDVIEDGEPLEDALQPVDLLDISMNGTVPAAETNGREPGDTSVGVHGSLKVLTAGHTTKDPAAVLADDRLKRLLDLLAQEADYVIVDVPPVPLGDAHPLVSDADRVLVVARQGRTNRDTAHAVRETLSNLSSDGFSVVLTDADTVET